MHVTKPYLVHVVAVPTGDVDGRGAAREGHGPGLHHELLVRQYRGALRHAALRRGRARGGRGAAARAARPV